MASPFSVFRRHQKVLLAVVSIGAMVAFVFLDPVMKYLGQGPPVENPVVVESKYGKWTQAQLDGLRAQREMVNRFLQNVTYQTVMAQSKSGLRQPHQLEMQAQQLYMFWHQMLLARTKPGPEESAVETLVLSRKAASEGMVVSDQSINDLLRQITDNSLTSDVLQQVIGQLSNDRSSASVTRLFDALRTELLASKYSQNFYQSVRDTTPAQRFTYYEALNRRAKAEVLPLSVASFVGQIAQEPSAAEVQKLYDAHKDAFPDPASPEPGFKEPKRASFQYFKADYAKLIEEFKPQVTEAEIAEYYEKNKQTQFQAAELPGEDADKAKDNERSSEDKPAADQPADEAKPEAAPSEQAGEEKPAADKPAEEKPADEAPAADKPAEPAAEPKPEGEKPADAPEPQAARAGAAFRLVSQETASEAPAAEDKPAEGAAPAAEPAAESKPKAPTAEPAADAKPTEDKPAEETPAEEKPAAEDKPAEKPEVKYLPLEKVKDSIRESIAGGRAMEKITKTFEELQGVMRRFADELDIYSTSKEKSGKPPVFPFDELAKANGLEAKALDMVTAAQAAESDLGHVNRITEASGFNFRRQPFSEFAFADSLVTYRPEIGQDDDGNAYLYWKTEEKAAFVPPLDDIRDTVVRTWKLQQARDLARKRAEELALQARAAKKPLKEVFAESKELAVTETDWFSWLTTGNVPLDPTSMQPRISQVEGVEYPDDDFMKAVFALSPGEIAVAPNHPQAIYYVVRLAEFERPEDELRNDFAHEPPNRYMMVADRDRRKVYMDWLADLTSEAKVQWLRPADSEARRSRAESQEPVDLEF